MGVDDGQITDIVIHYDGYVYVLVSQTGSKNFTDMYMVNNFNSDSTTTVYSRGAIVRFEPTSSGFKLSAKLAGQKIRELSLLQTKIKILLLVLT